MPISQDRLLELLQAGERFARLYSKIRNKINSEIEDITFNDRTADNAVRSIAQEILDDDYYHAGIVLNTERNQYNITNRRNSWQKRYAKRKRAEQAVMQGHSVKPYVEQEIKKATNAEQEYSLNDQLKKPSLVREMRYTAEEEGKLIEKRMSPELREMMLSHRQERARAEQISQELDREENQSNLDETPGQLTLED